VDTERRGTTLRTRPATSGDAPAIAEIYNQGIADRTATFETEPRSAEERRAWLADLAGRYPAVVVESDGQVVGWAAAGSYSPRACYGGIGSASVYVHRDWRGRGVGSLLLDALIAEAERLGLWKLVSRVFVFNAASRALCRKHGFREVGIYEKHAKLDGRWIDCVIVERLIPANLR
jgi:phosphinothricin acetyltransferase